MVALTKGPVGLVAQPGRQRLWRSYGLCAGRWLCDRACLWPKAWPPGTPAEVTLFGATITPPRLAIIGSHCIGLRGCGTWGGCLADQGISARILATGSQGGLSALRRRDCDIAPIHLMQADSGVYNRPFLLDGMRLIQGWRRMQGLVYRPGDARL